MFSQKKKSYTWVYVSIVLVIAIAAVIILIGALTSGDNSEDTLQTNLETQAEQREAEGGNDDAASSLPDENSVEEPTDEENDDTEKNSDDTKFYSAYYLVKADKNSIKIYFSDETGRLTELEETTIVFETLGAEDQQRFIEGIKVESRDDLNRLMMDYES